MDMLNTIAAAVPATGDRFPVIPLVIAIGAAVAIVIVTTVIAVIKKKKDDGDDE